jgi:phosphohistidine phosphatase
LYIIRHAVAEERDRERWPDDGQRPLTEKGAARFRKLVKRLAKQGLAPTLIATSPLLRCRQTAAIVQEVIGSQVEVVPRDELAPGSDLDGIVARSAQHEGDLAWVGHAPDVGDLAAGLIGDGAAALHFAKGAVAAIEFDGPLERGAGRLRWLVPPRLLAE